MGSSNKRRKMGRDPVDEPPIWIPSDLQVKRAVERLELPPTVHVSALPQNANIYSGENIPPNTLVLAPQHLRFLSFPLHPVVVLMWRVLGLHPMQLNPNSYLLISAFLAMSCKWGVSLGLTDFFYVHNCLKIPKWRRYFSFSPYPNQKCIQVKPSNYAGWKSSALMISGDWLPVEFQLLPPRQFGYDIDFKPSHTNINLQPERLEWLKFHIIGQDWPATQFVSPESLKSLAVNRVKELFDRYRQYIDPTLAGEPLAIRVAEIESGFYRCASSEYLLAESIKEKETIEDLESVSEQEAEGDVEVGYEEHVDLSEERETIEEEDVNVRDIPQRHPLAQKTKKQRLDKPTTSMGTSGVSSNMPRGNIPLTSIFSSNNIEAFRTNSPIGVSLPLPHPPKVLTMNFRKSEKSLVAEHESLLSNDSAAVAVVRGLASRSPDFDTLAKKSSAELFKSACSSHLGGLLATHALLTGLHHAKIKLEQELSEAKILIGKKDLMLEANMGELQRNAKSLEDMALELSQVKSDLERVKLAKDRQFERATRKIEVSCAKYYRLGWNQALTDGDDRCYGPPDAIDKFFDCAGMAYSPITGMMPGDVASPDSSVQGEFNLETDNVLKVAEGSGEIDLEAKNHLDP